MRLLILIELRLQFRLARWLLQNATTRLERIQKGRAAN
jgi:hypothetical protein